MNQREDFKKVVVPFFDKIRSYDSKLHGKLSDYLVSSYYTCLANKSEFVDYGFIPKTVEPKKIKQKEDMLIAGNAFKIAISECGDCNDSEMLDIYKAFREVGKKRGWSGLEFDKSCLNSMGVVIKQIAPPAYIPQIQMGKDYN
ncbi:hypothetical protein M0P65_05445 [Candidatus Gracilibacteria bacterium]|nr:hypothetical protein [Candidatus Gracilibacteria bacterium]